MPNLVFPGFEILAELGQGTSGIVYKAKDLRIGRVVALKALLLTDSQETREQFLLEARVLAGLTRNPDPTIPSIHMVGECRGQPFYIREFADGDTLEHRVTAGTIGFRSAVESIAVVASAVARVHQIGIEHGNLYPSNVLIAIDGTTKLIGFGRVARLDAPDFSRAIAPRVAGVGDVAAMQEILKWLCARMTTVTTGLESTIETGSALTATDLHARLGRCLEQWK